VLQATNNYKMNSFYKRANEFLFFTEDPRRVTIKQEIALQMLQRLKISKNFYVPEVRRIPRNKFIL